MQPIEIAGQIISIIAVIVSFITYQMKSSRSIFVTLSIATGISCVAYALLGGTVALVLNLVSIVRNIGDKTKFSFWLLNTTIRAVSQLKSGSLIYKD